MLFGRPLFAIIGMAYTITVESAPSDWNGVFSGAVFGGNMSVCVSEVSGTFYGQAVFSSVGYMRGTIDGADIWTGNYYAAGVEAMRGTFSLSLAASEYAGEFDQSPAGTVTYAVSGVQLTTEQPYELDCFKTDDNLLTTTELYDITGTYYSQHTTARLPWYVYVDDAEVFSSSYSYSLGSDKQGHGTSTGTAHANGQVITDQWYESGDANGLELLVAKNDSAYYNMFWGFQNLASFNYSMKSTKFSTHLNTKDNQVSIEDTIANSTLYNCYILWTEATESACFTISTVDNTCDDDDDGISAMSNNLIIVAATFSTLSFFGIVAALAVLLCFNNPSKSNALASSGISSTA